MKRTNENRNPENDNGTDEKNRRRNRHKKNENFIEPVKEIPDITKKGFPDHTIKSGKTEDPDNNPLQPKNKRNKTVEEGKNEASGDRTDNMNTTEDETLENVDD